MIFTTDQTMASHLRRRYLQWASIRKQYAAILSMDVNGISSQPGFVWKWATVIFFHGES